MNKAKRFQARKYESELERWGKLNDKKVSEVTPHLQEHLKVMSISLTVVVPGYTKEYTCYLWSCEIFISFMN